MPGLGDEQLVAADALGRVLRRVGRAEQVARAPVLVVQAGDAAGHRQRAGRARRRAGAPRRARAAARRRRRGPRAGTQNSSPPSRQVIAPGIALGRPRRAPGPAATSARSPASWPSRSLTSLSPSRSQKTSARSPPLAWRGRDRVLHPLVERAAVGQPGERVAVREVLEPGEELRAADRRRHLRAQRLGEAHVRVGERRRVDGRVGLQHAPHAAAAADRRGERGAAADPLAGTSRSSSGSATWSSAITYGRASCTSVRSSAVSVQVSFSGPALRRRG